LKKNILEECDYYNKRSTDAKKQIKEAVHFCLIFKQSNRAASTIIISLEY